MTHSIISVQKNATSEDFRIALQSEQLISLDSDAISRIEKGRAFLNEKSKNQKEPIYGVNTGFGSLCNTIIDEDDLETLQRNLLLSHACGMGEEVPEEVVKLMLLLKIRGLSYGHSGVNLQTVQRLIDFYNLKISPVVYQQGSLGASGDLAPLAHLSLPLIGEGEVYFNGVRMHACDALKQAGLEPIRLHSKEGLALINGTQFMSAYGVWCVIRASEMLEKSYLIAAMSLDGYDGRIEPFDAAIHVIRPHHGQIMAAGKMKSLLEGSEIVSRKKEHVQDPYSFRCIPQVHGASADAINFVCRTIETEINSVTDNPIIIPDEDKIISGGNFHGQPLALALDFLAIAAAELGSISERRTYKLIGGQRGLPPYLIREAGLNSGFMIPQYTAASIVSQNKQYCTPSSVDTIDSSNGQEDHVSMGANSATKCFRVIENLRSILAIELLTSAQALDFRRPLKSSASIEALHSEVRRRIPFNEKDNFLSEQMHIARQLI